ncbi:HWE histidine kinase domain-containing protein [Bosea sp. (in: a-proteobacteria)]|uniref:HWE histidine kinase domain-containing protein n=1 Tax=Bosea sp. (in: a-proteobacteria) TaxID=1871050 RepID=UPI0027341EBC|nr:HWE histidine kinase domain-containing protein [Bosea sp. (in: a-proteobacteria)]MDP3409926.1 HWE histidine kinase domain-containing protein [Bosea sp. (in: a-proteobacteria)]
MAGGSWPVGGGEVGALLRGWTGADTALGPVAGWPERLRSALQMVLTSPTPMVILWGAEGRLLYNDAYLGIAGVKHPDILGRSLLDAWPEVADFHNEVMATVFVGGAPLSYRDLPLVLHRSGVAEDVWLNVDYSPLFDDGGAVLGVLAVVTETTTLVRAQRERDAAAQALRRREQELAQVQKIGKVGGLEVDLRDGFRNTRSPEYLLVHGLPPDAVHESHEDWVRRIHPQERAVVESHFRETVAGTATDYQMEYRIIRPSDGAERWISAVAQIERDADGRPLRLVGAHIDITERKETEAQLRLLMQELAHRVKNTLAMIQAIASQTLRGATSLEAANETFSARLAALARAHDLLLGGHQAHAAMADIADSIIGIQGDPSRFVIRGPEVVLGPRAALALTLVLHELATNAVKYGSLSNQTGRVALSWRIDEIDGMPQFRLRWQESGGPPVTPPSRRGFGSRLIERTMPASQGRADSAFLPTGLVFTLDAQLAALKDGEGEEAGRS